MFQGIINGFLKNSMYSEPRIRSFQDFLERLFKPVDVFDDGVFCGLAFAFLDGIDDFDVLRVK